jgi:hypothetical protein
VWNKARRRTGQDRSDGEEEEGRQDQAGFRRVFAHQDASFGNHVNDGCKPGRDWSIIMRTL